MNVNLLYNPVRQEVPASWSRCWNENHVPEEAGLPGPRFSSPGERERNAAVARRVRGSICCSSVQSPTHLTDNTFHNPFEPFRIKWEVYFSKELGPLVLIVLNMFLYAYVYIVVSRLYNNDRKVACSKYYTKERRGNPFFLPRQLKSIQEFVRSYPNWKTLGHIARDIMPKTYKASFNTNILS